MSMATPTEAVAVQEEDKDIGILAPMDKLGAVVAAQDFGQV